MKKILVLSSDTPHHRYFINALVRDGAPLAGCLFETVHTEAPFPTGPLFEREELEFENETFFREMDRELPRGLATEIDTVNSGPSLAAIRSIGPDFGIVFGTGKIGKEAIALFKDGLINVHRGIAQEYRGLDSDLWAIYHGDYGNLGVTIHRVDPALDTGDIVYQDRMTVRRDMKIHQIRYHTSLIATELVRKAVADYGGKGITFHPQEKAGRYYSFMPLELKRRVALKFNKYCESRT